jgi:hypothetical protein
MDKDSALCETLNKLLCIKWLTASWNTVLIKINNPVLETQWTYAQNVHVCKHLKCIEEQISQYQKKERHEYERFRNIV